jgi:hypothetical protein
MSSWWLLWEDLIFPEDGIVDKIARRAKKFNAAGINTVVIFGCHFRWDYIYNWERFHYLLKCIVDACHEEGIKVFDHHSANLVHRAGNLAEYRNINTKNRHHVPFFPSREFADSITFDGCKLNDFRMLSVQDGKPCYLNTYNAEIFCMNNPDFVAAYRSYLEQLLKTGVDGLMCDDVIYYPGWDACGCDCCRKKFKTRYGHDLPSTTNGDFWGNYDSHAFKDWMYMRYHDPLDFLNIVKEAVGKNFPLMSCCASSSLKTLDRSGMNAIIMSGALNNIMLEMCGEVIPGSSGYSEHIPDLALHKAIADKHRCSNIGLGYAHNPDSAFVIWALNKLFASSTWISTLTGRFGVPEEIRKTIPDEADVIGKAYNFEKKHEYLFSGRSLAKLAVLFSLDNLIYNGCAQSDYSQPWRKLTAELVRNNIQFDVVLDIPSADEYPVLLLGNFDCISCEIQKQLRNYMKHGGIIIAAGLLGFRNERGELTDTPFVADWGIELRNGRFNWNIPCRDLFNFPTSVPENSSSSYEIYRNGIKLELDQWISSNNFHWLPQMCISEVLDKVRKVLPPDEFEISCPPGWIHRILRDNDSGRYFIHLLAADIEAVPYKHFRNTLLDEPIIEKLNFIPGDGELSFTAPAADAVLYSPDLSASVKLKSINGNFNFRLNNIEKYLIIELCRFKVPWQKPHYLQVDAMAEV